MDKAHDVYNLALPSGEIEGVIGQDASILAEKQKETDAIFTQWRDSVKDILLGIESETNPKELIRMIAVMLLNAYESAQLLDNYDVYDCLLNYWNAKLQMMFTPSKPVVMRSVGKSNTSMRRRKRKMKTARRSPWTIHPR